MKQDIEASRKDVKDLTLRVEQLERDKVELETKINKGADTTNFVTHDELKLLEIRMNDTIAEESKRVEAAIKDDMKAALPAPISTETPTAKLNITTKNVAKPSSSGPIPVSDAEKQSYMKEGVRYVIQPGDTLSSIAKKNHSSVRAILATNSIASPNKLYVGRELFIPTL